MVVSADRAPYFSDAGRRGGAVCHYDPMQSRRGKGRPKGNRNGPRRHEEPLSGLREEKGGNDED